LQSDIATAMKPKWYVLGTRGAIVGEWRDEPVPADFPARVKVLRPAANGGAHDELISLPAREVNGFYRNLADHMAWDEPLAVTPAEARRTVAVMEAAARSIARDGDQLKVDI
jgi:predicted dehydrogenase